MSLSRGAQLSEVAPCIAAAITKDSRRSADLWGQRSPGARKQSGWTRAAREGTPECTGLELDPPEPESIQQAVSDKVPGKGSGGNRELGRAGNQAALNRRQHAREDLEAAGAALGTGSVWTCGWGSHGRSVRSQLPQIARRSKQERILEIT